MNTAGRLLSIYNSLVGQAWRDQATVNVWAEVFEIPEDTPYLEDAVVACLQALRAELDLLQAQLRSLGVPEELLNPGVPRFRNAASPAYLNAPWNGSRDDVARLENRPVFQWATWILREEAEDDMHAEELAALRQEIDSLDSSLAKAEMSPYLREFIQRQLDAVRTALRVYKIRGANPIKDAVHKTAAAYAFEKKQVDAEVAKAEEPAKGLVARAAALLGKTASIADNLKKVGEAVEGAQKLGAVVQPLIEPYTKLLLGMAKDIANNS